MFGVSGLSGPDKKRKKSSSEEITEEEAAEVAESTLNASIGKLKSAGPGTIKKTKTMLKLIKQLLG
jgi:hypothetical protein